MTLIASWHGSSSPILFADNLLSKKSDHDIEDDPSQSFPRLSLPSTGEIPNTINEMDLLLLDMELAQKLIIPSDNLALASSWDGIAYESLKNAISELVQNAKSLNSTKSILWFLDDNLKDHVDNLTILGLNKDGNCIENFVYGNGHDRLPINNPSYNNLAVHGSGYEHLEEYLSLNSSELESINTGNPLNDDILHYGILSGSCIGSEFTQMATLKRSFGGNFEMAAYSKEKKKFLKCTAYNYIIWIAKKKNKGFELIPARIFAPKYHGCLLLVRSADLKISDSNPFIIEIQNGSDKTDKIFPMFINEEEKINLLPRAQTVVQESEKNLLSFNCKSQVHVVCVTDKLGQIDKSGILVLSNNDAAKCFKIEEEKIKIFPELFARLANLFTPLV